MENDKNKIIIDDDESMNFLSNINNKNNNKLLNKIKIVYKILFYLLLELHHIHILLKEDIIIKTLTTIV